MDSSNNIEMPNEGDVTIDVTNDGKADQTEIDSKSSNENNAVRLLPGEAPIKQEYILPKPVKIFNIDEPKEELKAEPDVDDNDSPVPKKKIKGQNKNRPRTVPKTLPSERLCPSIVRESECNFGEKCRYNHDTASYLAGKKADIGQKCVNYETLGKCPYGIVCRFASSHIDNDGKNRINKEIFNASVDGPPFIRNGLSKDIQSLLRKKKYGFERSKKVLKQMNENYVEVAKEEDFTKDDTSCEGGISLTSREKKTIDFSDKLYLAPLTTVGNLPFRRVCKQFGADVTCSEMAMSVNLLQGQSSEWALVKRHSSEDLFGIQLCGSFPDTMTRCAELLSKTAETDFIDVNIGCPIDLVFKRGGGCALMGRKTKFEQIVRGMVEVSDVPITVKMRTGIYEKAQTAHKIIPDIRSWGASLVTLHGRSREQRYTRLADWEYINHCAEVAKPMPLFGNGDVLSYEDANLRREATGVSGLMIARGALIKPWIFTEIKEQRHWDISSNERLDILKEYVDCGLQHWGSDDKGIENTRRFLLEWLSFLHRYIPVGLLEVLPQGINDRPPCYCGRNDLETMFASTNSNDWVKISEMLLGPVPDNFAFVPKHRANSYNSR